MLKDITIVIIAFNAESKIENTLKCFLKWKNLIVIDNNSTDNTVEISSKYTEHIYHSSLSGLAEIRNFAITKVKTKWVLFIDSDELLNDLNQKELKKIFLSKKNKYDGYWFSRRNYYSNNPASYLKYGLFYPDYQLRLFKTIYRYSYNIHEIPEIQSTKTKHLSNVEIYHYPDYSKYFTFGGIKKFKNFINIYSKPLVKKPVLYLLYQSISSFFNLFFVSLTRGKGILDGYKGIIAAFNFASQISLIYIYAIYTKRKN
jgi:glycosyltransferase involved in cell wall biosynthesis